MQIVQSGTAPLDLEDIKRRFGVDDWEGRRFAPLPVRLLRRVTPNEQGCWLWPGATSNGGYGHIREDKDADGRRRSRGTHKVAYELIVGPVPPGLHLDHLCREVSCCNPDHLEPVTNRENLLRGHTFNAANVAKTHCNKGHELAGDNLWGTEHHRVCRVCKLASNRAYQARRRAVA